VHLDMKVATEDCQQSSTTCKSASVSLYRFHTSPFGFEIRRQRRFPKVEYALLWYRQLPTLSRVGCWLIGVHCTDKEATVPCYSDHSVMRRLFNHGSIQ
jgi:hypothetical protein